MRFEKKVTFIKNLSPLNESQIKTYLNPMFLMDDQNLELSVQTILVFYFNLKDNIIVEDKLVFR